MSKVKPTIKMLMAVHVEIMNYNSAASGLMMTKQYRYTCFCGTAMVPSGPSKHEIQILI
jgi:hypothetical protein